MSMEKKGKGGNGEEERGKNPPPGDSYRLSIALGGEKKKRGRWKMRREGRGRVGGIRRTIL